MLCYPEGKYSHLTMDVAKDYYTFALRMDGWTYQTGMDPYQVPAQLRLTPHHAAGLSVVPRPVRKSVLKTNAQPAPQHLRRRLCVYST